MTIDLENIVLNKNLFALAGLAVLATTSQAQTLFSSQASGLGDFVVVAQSDSSAAVVNYSSFSVGASNFSLAEAPRMISGSTATTGILLKSNKGDATAAVSSINLILGAAAQSFTGHYIFSYDLYMRAPVPAIGNGTEFNLFGVGRTTAGTSFGRNNRLTAGEGTWGWIDTDGGNGTGTTSGDFAIRKGTDSANLAQFDNLDSIAQSTFTTPTYAVAGTPGNNWTKVDIEVNNGTAIVSFNGVQFFTQTTNLTDGFAWIGYEDPFSSVSLDPTNNWGLIDNITVTAVPEPATMAIVGLGALAALKRRKRA